MKGDTITMEEFFDEIKTDQQVQGKLQNSIIFKVAENGYGDKVDKKDIDKMFNEQKEQFGDQFESQLAAAGMTEAKYKETIKQSLAFKKMQESHVKVTDKDLKAVWATFHPEVEVDLIGMTDEKEAKKVLEKVKDGDDFAKLAKKYSEDPSKDEKGRVMFDSTSTAVPEEVQAAAYKLKDGKTSDLIEVTQTGQDGSESKGYYIVKMVKNQEKGNDMKPFKKKLTKLATDQKMADSEFIQSVISKELKKANVKIKDNSLKGVLAGFVEEEPAKKEDKKADDKSEDKKDKKADDEKKSKGKAEGESKTTVGEK